MVSDSAADTSQGDDAVQDEDSLPADDQNNENVRAADDAHVSEDVKDDDDDDQSDDDNQAEDSREDGEEVKSDEPAIPDLSSDGDDDRVSENVKDGDDDDQSDEQMESDENVQAADDSGQTDNLVLDEDDQDADNSFNEADQAEDDDQPAADTSQEDDAVQDEDNLPADADEQDNENVAAADDANVSEDFKEGDDEDQSDDDNQAENAQKGGEEDDEEDGEEAKADEPAVPDLSTDESDDEDKRRSKVSDDFVYDFDLMMAKKKEESYHRRKRKNIDIINDNDDIIAELITQMKQSADDDFELNKNRKAATCKLKLLPVLETQLRKIDLREAFLDAGVLGVITDWLTPLPDRSLPNLQVRETMLKLLGEFNIMDVERLKASGIGKAVMYLYKHPKETKENKKRAGALISSWSRPIFSLDSDFHTMSKEEREQRDFDHMTKLSENKRVRVEPKTPPSSSRKTQPEPEKTLRPGDKGWIPRARVPAPSTRDYVVRPKSNVDSEMTKSGSKKAITRLDKHLRNFREKKKLMKTQRAVAISIEGRRMSL